MFPRLNGNGTIEPSGRPLASVTLSVPMRLPGGAAFAVSGIGWSASTNDPSQAIEPFPWMVCSNEGVSPASAPARVNEMPVTMAGLKVIWSEID